MYDVTAIVTSAILCSVVSDIAVVTALLNDSLSHDEVAQNNQSPDLSGPEDPVPVWGDREFPWADTTVECDKTFDMEWDCSTDGGYDVACHINEINDAYWANVNEMDCSLDPSYFIGDVGQEVFIQNLIHSRTTTDDWIDISPRVPVTEKDPDCVSSTSTEYLSCYSDDSDEDTCTRIHSSKSDSELKNVTLTFGHGEITVHLGVTVTSQRNHGDMASESTQKPGHVLHLSSRDNLDADSITDHAKDLQQTQHIVDTNYRLVDIPTADEQGASSTFYKDEKVIHKLKQEREPEIGDFHFVSDQKEPNKLGYFQFDLEQMEHSKFAIESDVHNTHVQIDFEIDRNASEQIDGNASKANERIASNICDDRFPKLDYQRHSATSVISVENNVSRNVCQSELCERMIPEVAEEKSPYVKEVNFKADNSCNQRQRSQIIQRYQSDTENNNEGIMLSKDKVMMYKNKQQQKDRQVVTSPRNNGESHENRRYNSVAAQIACDTITKSEKELLLEFWRTMNNTTVRNTPDSGIHHDLSHTTKCNEAFCIIVEGTEDVRANSEREYTCRSLRSQHEPYDLDMRKGTRVTSSEPIVSENLNRRTSHEYVVPQNSNGIKCLWGRSDKKCSDSSDGNRVSQTRNGMRCLWGSSEPNKSNESGDKMHTRPRTSPIRKAVDNDFTSKKHTRNATVKKETVGERKEDRNVRERKVKAREGTTVRRDVETKKGPSTYRKPSGTKGNKPPSRGMISEKVEISKPGVTRGNPKFAKTKEITRQMEKTVVTTKEQNPPTKNIDMGPSAFHFSVQERETGPSFDSYSGMLSREVIFNSVRALTLEYWRNWNRNIIYQNSNISPKKCKVKANVSRIPVHKKDEAVEQFNDKGLKQDSRQGNAHEGEKTRKTPNDRGRKCVSSAQENNVNNQVHVGNKRSSSEKTTNMSKKMGKLDVPAQNDRDSNTVRVGKEGPYKITPKRRNIKQPVKIIPTVEKVKSSRETANTIKKEATVLGKETSIDVKRSACDSSKISDKLHHCGTDQIVYCSEVLTKKIVCTAMRDITLEFWREWNKIFVNEKERSLASRITKIAITGAKRQYLHDESLKSKIPVSKVSDRYIKSDKSTRERDKSKSMQNELHGEELAKYDLLFRSATDRSLVKDHTEENCEGKKQNKNISRIPVYKKGEGTVCPKGASNKNFKQSNMMRQRSDVTKKPMPKRVCKIVSSDISVNGRRTQNNAPSNKIYKRKPKPEEVTRSATKSISVTRKRTRIPVKQDGNKCKHTYNCMSHPIGTILKNPGEQPLDKRSKSANPGKTHGKRTGLPCNRGIFFEYLDLSKFKINKISRDIEIEEISRLLSKNVIVGAQMELSMEYLRKEYDAQKSIRREQTRITSTHRKEDANKERKLVCSICSKKGYRWKSSIPTPSKTLKEEYVKKMEGSNDFRGNSLLVQDAKSANNSCMPMKQPSHNLLSTSIFKENEKLVFQSDIFCDNERSGDFHRFGNFEFNNRDIKCVLCKKRKSVCYLE